MKNNDCVRVEVPKEACYISFKKVVVGETFQESIGYTIRGEEIIADIQNGKIVGFELVGGDKECQE